jgi:basic amino acid/polyamine antiporter, APA family
MNRSTPSVSSADAVAQPTTLPPALGCIDAISMIVGMVIGVGIFETPTMVANNVSTAPILIGLWILGGLLSLIGALCYAELATAYPHPGGNYYYLSRAFGPNLGFLFGWARMTVIQPGSITMLAFVFGDYASQLLPLGDYAVPIYAAGGIIFLTGMNLLGVREGKLTQNGLSIAKVLGLLLVILVGLVVVTANPGAAGTGGSVAPAAPPANNIGLAMIFVLLSYGGWNEAAYISAEIKDAKHNISRALLWSIGLISAVYVLINLAYLHGLGLQGMAKSEAVAADLLRQAVGQPAALLVSLLVAVSALGAANATIFTGARTNFALGKDFPLFKGLGQWRELTHTPTTALLVQGVISLVLVVLGAMQRKGFETMVYYTTPIFWLFFLLSGVALFILRSKEAKRPRPFQVPLYPLTPLLFCSTCGYLFYSSITYAASQPAGIGVYIGIAVLLLGVPILIWGRQHPDTKPHPPQ